MNQQQNVVNVVFRDRQYAHAMPEYVAVKTPKTRAQRLVRWLGEKLKLYEPHRPVEMRCETKSIVLSGEARDVIGRAVLGFMSDNPGLNPARDLVILWGSADFAAFIRAERLSMMTDMNFARADGPVYRGLRVILVSYLSGPLVVRRSDLA